MATTPPQHPAPDLPPGFSFDPENEELLAVYLRSRIARIPLPAATARFFHDADVYAADPATLVAGLLPAPARICGRKNWFFFSSVRPKSCRDSRKNRMVGDGKGTWKAELGKDVVDDEGRVLGHLHRFTYKNKNGGKPEWLMVEFGVDREDDDEGRRGEPVPVLCKIYQSPRFLGSASKPSSSSESARKRKATDERPGLPSSSSPVVRRQLFPSPPAPTPPDEGPTFDLDDFLMPVEPQPQPQLAESQGETSPLNSSFSMADHALSELSCCGTTVLGDGVDWGIPPCSSGAEDSGSWTGSHTTASCTSGMEFLAGQPTGEELGQDASNYWCGEPSAPGSSAASTLFCGGVGSCNAIAAP